jgi:hypothetical protein
MIVYFVRDLKLSAATIGILMAIVNVGLIAGHSPTGRSSSGSGSAR